MVREGTGPDSLSILEYTQVTRICKMFADDCTVHILFGKSILLDYPVKRKNIALRTSNCSQILAHENPVSEDLVRDI